MKILFAAPYVLETISETPVYPMHRTTQDFVDALRAEGYEVFVVSTESQFESEYSNHDLIIVMADGNWMCQTIDKVQPNCQVLYFFIISRPRSRLVISRSFNKLPPSQMLELVSHFLIH